MKVDVCVIGAGPAGTSLALRLAQLGLSVCMVERRAFPREHIGESLSPGIWSQLDMLGAREAMEAMNFQPCREVLLHWQAGPPEKREQHRQPGLLVDRGRFDHLLLRLAQGHGVKVLQPAALASQQRQPGGGWRLVVATGGGDVEIEARLLADATGRSAILRGPRRPTGPRTLSLYAYWAGETPQIPRIEAGTDHWYWGVPLPNGLYNAMVFVDMAAFRARKNASVEEAYNALMGQCGLLRGCDRAQPTGPVQVVDASPGYSQNAIGADFIKVGGSALVIDPLSSSGVQKSIQTALAGAIAVNTLLRRPEYAAGAMEFHQNNIQDSAERHQMWAQEFYQTAAEHMATPFWRARARQAAPPALPPTPPDGDALRHMVVAVSPQTEWVDVPCITGDFIESRPGLKHPGLDRPAAFFGGHALQPLLQPAPCQPMTVLDLVRQWSPLLPMEAGMALAAWLLGFGALRPVAETPP